MHKERPQTFEQWRNCIERDCGIELSKPFCSKRINVLSDSESAETKRFVQCHGQRHLAQVLLWFNQVNNER
jgi:hypothetical protein